MGDGYRVAEQLCAMHDELGLTDESAPEVVVIVEAALSGGRAVIAESSPVARALRRSFPSAHEVWRHVSIVPAD